MTYTGGPPEYYDVIDTSDGGSWVGFILSNRADMDPDEYVDRIDAIWHGEGRP